MYKWSGIYYSFFHHSYGLGCSGSKLRLGLGSIWAIHIKSWDWPRMEVGVIMISLVVSPCKMPECWCINISVNIFDGLTFYYFLCILYYYMSWDLIWEIRVAWWYPTRPEIFGYIRPSWWSWRHDYTYHMIESFNGSTW